MLDNDYARQYGTAPIDALRVTAAHEFFHAIQFAYDVGEDLWFMEGSATWVEDEVYDAINDNYQFLADQPDPVTPAPPSTTAADTFPYGVVHLLQVRRRAPRGLRSCRQFWESAEIGSRTSCRRSTASWAPPRGPAFFTTFGSWNTLPLHSYSERAGYPPPAWWLKKTLTSRQPHHRLAQHQHRAPRRRAHAGRRRAATLSPSRRLLVEVNGPNRSTGTAALLQRRFRDGHVTHTMITLEHQRQRPAPWPDFNRNVPSPRSP